MENPFMKLFRSKINTAVSLLILLLFTGIVGFKLMSNYSWLDAVYMTVITVTTVGFGEVQPLDTHAKIFTVFLILTSVFIVGYAFKIITEYLISKNDISELKYKKMQKEIDSLSNHIVICGFGRNGKQSAKKLLMHNRSFVVIESDKKLIEKLQNIGLTQNESRVYLFLLEYQEAKTGIICSKLNIANSHIYRILEKLLDKGLVSYKINNNIKIFQAVNPSNLYELFREKEEQLEKEKQDLK